MDQYVPSVPGGTSGKSKSTRAQPNQSSSGSADDQALAQITGDGNGAGSKSSKKSSSKKNGGEGGNDSSKAIPVAGSGGGGDDDGAVGSVASALTDWNDPLLPGLVALAALFTLGAAVIALARRRRI